MKIREILELTQSMNIAAIAKEHLSIGEKRVRAILKELGCTNQAGKKGWIYAGNKPEILEQSIYDFCTPKAIHNNNASKGNSKHDNIKSVNKDIVKNNKEETNIKAEIQELISGKIASKPAKVYKGIYFDNDIAAFLDHIQHGNKSELVNKIMRAFLVENDLL